MDRPFDKESLNKIFELPHIHRNIEELTRQDAYNIDIVVNGVTFSSLFFKSQTKRLYVILSAQGNNVSLGKYPVFQKLFWAQYLDGFALYLDDPTRPLSGFSPCWYLGTPQDNYLEYVKLIIQKIQGLHDIKNQEVIICGSSNAGFASLYLGSVIQKSFAVALCPQLNIPIYLEQNGITKDFEQKTHFLITNKILNIVPTLLNNKNSKFFIATNLASDIDFSQHKFLCDCIGKNPNEEGLIKVNKNFFVGAYRCSSFRPHWVQPMENFFIFICNQMKSGFLDSALEYKAHVECLKRYYKLETRLQNYESKQNAKYIARLDIKNCGVESNAIEILSVSDKDASITSPRWFIDEHGCGRVFESMVKSIKIAFRCVGEGRCKIFLRSKDIKDENNKRIPIFIKYKSFCINEKEQLVDPKEISHDMPFIYELPVKDGEIVTVYTEW